MKSKVRLWLLLLPAALAVVVGWWVLITPRPPDFTRRGFTSVRAVFSRQGTEPLATSSNDPGVVGGLATALRSGHSTSECKCGVIGRLMFDEPDGTTEEVGFVPAHGEGTIEFRWRDERFVLAAEPFLKAAEPLGIPSDRWQKRPNEYR